MDQELILLYIILGGVIGIIYSLRRIYSLEKNLAMLEGRITEVLKKRKR